MSDEIELISDGDGLAVIGEPKAVDRFLSSAGVASKDLQLHQKLGSALNAGSGVAQAGSQLAANSGRWVKLTEESAKALKVGKAMKGSSDGVSRAIATTSKGKITKILEFTKPGSVGSMLTNPAMLAGAAGIMAQLAMQQTMEEITEYLKVIDEKVDDILLAQKNAEIAKMIGVGMVIDDAMFKREHIGRVSEVTWSNLHGAAQTIATAQAYALLQLDALAKKMEKKSKVGDLGAAAVRDAVDRAIRETGATLVVSPHPHDGHHGHEAVGRGVRDALQTRPALRWWMWGLWSDVPFPTLMVPIDQAVLAEVAYAIEAYEGENQRNGYHILYPARATAAAVLGSERVLGFGAAASCPQPNAELLTEASYQGETWRAGTARILDPAYPMAPIPNHGLDLTSWLNSPSPRQIIGSTPN